MKLSTITVFAAVLTLTTTIASKADTTPPKVQIPAGDYKLLRGGKHELDVLIGKTGKMRTTRKKDGRKAYWGNPRKCNYKKYLTYNARLPETVGCVEYRSNNSRAVFFKTSSGSYKAKLFGIGREKLTWTLRK